MKERYKEIDYLRGFAIFIMITTHSFSYYLNNALFYTVWDLIHFIVPMLVFSSTYILFQRDLSGKGEKLISYLKKRFNRLLIPYWIFISILFLFFKFFDPTKFNILNFLNNFFLVGGLDMNWLVLLFIYITIISRLFLYIKNFFILTLLLFIFSLLSTITLLFIHPSISYRYTMWLPWTIVVLYTFLYVKFNNNKFILISLIFSVLIFIVSRIIIIQNNQSLSLFSNKYPPNIYYLSYGIIWLNICLLIFKSKVFYNLPITKFLNYLSKNSYGLFFIHFLVIFILNWVFNFKQYNIALFFSVVLSSSIFIQVVMNNIYYKAKFFLTKM